MYNGMQCTASHRNAPHHLFSYSGPTFLRKLSTAMRPAAQRQRPGGRSAFNDAVWLGAVVSLRMKVGPLQDKTERRSRCGYDGKHGSSSSEFHPKVGQLSFAISAPSQTALFRPTNLMDAQFYSGPTSPRTLNALLCSAAPSYRASTLCLV